jgi:hypothetical protein
MLQQELSETGDPLGAIFDGMYHSHHIYAFFGLVIFVNRNDYMIFSLIFSLSTRSTILNCNEPRAKFRPFRVDFSLLLLPFWHRPGQTVRVLAGSPLRLHFTSLRYDAMPLLRRLPPVPTTTATLSHHHVHLVTPLRTPPSSLRLAHLRICPAPSIRPLRAIPSTRCHAAGDPASSTVPSGGSARAALVRIGEALSLGFPVWVASACALALWRPATFLWVSPTTQMIGLSFTMLGTYYPPWPHPRFSIPSCVLSPSSELKLCSLY